MSITNYGELRTAVADWLNRDDIDDARLREFVQIAENRIFHVLRIPPMEKFANITTDTAGRVTIPGDFLEAKDVLFDGKPLDRLTTTEFYARTAMQGTPVAFARETIYLRLWPTPGPSVAGMSMIYFALPDALSDANPTNPVFAMAPEMYLYGALVAAGAYLGSPIEKIQVWSESFNDTIRRITDNARQAEVSGATNSVLSGY